MKPLPRGLLLLMTVVWGLSGCASRPTVEPPPPDVMVSQPEVSPERGETYTQVTASARYMWFNSELPDAKGALAFLSDLAKLQAGGIALTQEQADSALEALKRATNQDVLSTLAVTVGEGNTAKMSCTQGIADADESSSVTITVGGMEHELRTRVVGLALEITPQVLVDGSIQMDTEIQQTIFEGFVEYGGKAVMIPAKPDASGSIWEDALVKVPTGFLQPIFSTRSVRRDLKLQSGAVVVLLASAEVETDANLTGGSAALLKPVLGRLYTQPERWLVFLTAKTSQAKRVTSL